MALIIGSPAGQTHNGTNQADVIVALDGNDIINGNNGADVILAGNGSDTNGV